MIKLDPIIKWLEKNGLLKGIAAAEAAAPPSAASKQLLGTTAHGMTELVADEVQYAGGYAAPSVAGAPISPATAERASRAAEHTLHAAESGASIRGITQRPHPSQVAAPKPYDKRLHGDGGRVPDGFKGPER